MRSNMNPIAQIAGSRLQNYLSESAQALVALLCAVLRQPISLLALSLASFMSMPHLCMAGPTADTALTAIA